MEKIAPFAWRSSHLDNVGITKPSNLVSLLKMSIMVAKSLQCIQRNFLREENNDMRKMHLMKLSNVVKPKGA